MYSFNKYFLSTFMPQALGTQRWKDTDIFRKFITFQWSREVIHCRCKWNSADGGFVRLPLKQGSHRCSRTGVRVHPASPELGWPWATLKTLWDIQLQGSSSWKEPAMALSMPASLFPFTAPSFPVWLVYIRVFLRMVCRPAASELSWVSQKNLLD